MRRLRYRCTEEKCRVNSDKLDCIVELNADKDIPDDTYRSQEKHMLCPCGNVYKVSCELIEIINNSMSKDRYRKISREDIKQGMLILGRYVHTGSSWWKEGEWIVGKRTGPEATWELDTVGEVKEYNTYTETIRWGADLVPGFAKDSLYVLNKKYGNLQQWTERLKGKQTWEEIKLVLEGYWGEEEEIKQKRPVRRIVRRERKEHGSN